MCPKTDLNNCTVVLDHILRKDKEGWTIEFDRSLRFEGKSYSLGYYCLDNVLEKEEYVVVKTCEDVSICRNRDVRCIKKCCPDGQYYQGTSCSAGPYFGLSLESNTRFLEKNESFNAVMISEPCKRYIGNAKYNYSITEDGTTAIYEWGTLRHYSLEENYYCMEYIQVINKYEILLCMTHTRLTPTVGVKGVIMVVSCICLVLTVIGYFVLPDLKNIIGNIVITYCTCLSVAYILLTYLHFHPNPGKLCDYFAFAIAFSFLTAFTWMTILSYEIWKVLGSMVTEYGHRLPGERKRYLLYSIAGWSLPIIVITINFIDYTYNIFPESIHLVLGKTRCVFENIRLKGVYGYIFHFVVPCGILLFVNLIIFSKTISYIFHVKNEIRRMNILDSNIKQKRWKSLVADKEKVAMVIRIFLLMGINWLFETLSSIVDMQSNTTLSTIETIFDTINALEGVFIFCIFMLKKRILKSILSMLNIRTKNRRTSVATCSTEVVMLPTSARTSQS
ncbi:hypothetical protein Trydic_g10403 [Trypoxylus dichotomus]